MTARILVPIVSCTLPFFDDVNRQVGWRHDKLGLMSARRRPSMPPLGPAFCALAPPEANNRFKTVRIAATRFMTDHAYRT
jgi:hypothetical protein